MSDVSILDKIEWAVQTIRDQLLFGRDDLGAAKAREMRAKGVLLDCKKEITKLKKELEIANKAIGFYANKNNWLRSSTADVARKIGPEDLEEIKGYAMHCGGLNARKAQNQIKEALDEHWK